MIKIRTRIPEQDDKELFQLILTRLMPFARQARPSVKFRRSEIISRWRKCRVYVAEGSGGKPAGFISCKTEGTTLSIDMLAVSKSAEGRGIGSALIETAERYGRRQGAHYMQLGVDEPNYHARQFYERKGFRVESYLPEHRMLILSRMVR
ncbi:GNAT family N-acetyltransferase [Paenibacillus mesotrionivorans]|uniref:GNAT family N-acetyltransferase n=1 Tax=Paenibacillus mesotrionivorans TaxID=3160968 RepID=A0ACC7NT50_9BACL